MPLQATSGAASYDAFGGGVPVVPTYIEDVFSTWLYTGNGSTQTINNGIDLAGKGGLVWLKDRTAANGHFLFDTTRTSTLQTNNANAAGSGYVPTYFNFNSNGFFVDASGANYNVNGNTYASWTFREQPKFFDVVTYTGTGGGPSSVAHNLGAVPGFVLIKSTSRSGNWVTIARQSNGTYALFTDSTNGLQSTAAANNTSANPGAALTATTFDPSWFNNSNTPGAVQNICDNGVTYVAYLFAHNAGGFGLTGTDNVISCGSFTTNGSGAATVNLGYEPQFVMFKRTDGVGDWFLVDVMRGFTSDPASGQIAFLYPNTSAAEGVASGIGVTSTGFVLGSWFASQTYIYIAIRRGPMRTPTTGTSVFAVTTFTGVDTAQTAGFPVDFVPNAENFASLADWQWADRLRGSGRKLESNAANAEGATSAGLWDSNTQVRITSSGNSYPRLYPMFRRAPGFFDEVCYTGTGSARTVAHNLGVAPELLIVKQRSAGANKNWMVYSSSQGISMLAHINTTDQFYNPGVAVWGASSPTASVFSVGAGFDVNDSGSTYVAYLFASCPGVSKVGSYTGTGATQVINCGFTAGSRFVLIKATSTTGNWLVWDSARGIVAGNDPYLVFNTRDPEVTNTDWVDTAATGFELSNAGGNLANSNGVSYIFLAIA